MPRQTVQLRRQGGVATIELNRPRARNRVNAEVARELAEACGELDADATVRVVGLTGSGPAFSVGYAPPTGAGALVRATPALALLRKPVVAAINGDCLDQGLELALACDIRVSVREAHFGLGHVVRGLLPWDGGTQRLPRVVGRAHALRLLLTGEPVTAEEALRMGLVQHLASDGLEQAVSEVARRLVDGAPVAAAYAKEAVRAGMDLGLAQGLRLEADLGVLLHTTSDRQEGISSFLEHRSPRFLGQ